ncbi:MAG: zonular occludens toxin domain-containing protein [Anaerorhabdus sp.]|uniref:zonular occludens toxin domain-containing protein n=1 Tax=Anaerorhabdus sp. TaxID=1872524 RepID=UPI002FCBC736
MIKFLTGAIGTGKTTYCVDELLKVDEENNKHIKNGEPEKVRKIYSNISGLKVPHEPLPDDWRETPKGSIHAVDECHKIDIYKPSRKVLHDDPRIVALNESRHDGYDFYFITQSPKFLHQHIRGLVNQHFHFHNPMGLEVATVFMWRHGNTLNPDAQNSKSLAENEFIYTFKKNVQNNFKSIEDGATHTKKRNIPRKVIFWGMAPLVLLCGIGYLLMKPETTGNLTGETFANKTKSDAQKAEQSVQQIGQPVQQNNLDIECRKGVNVEKPECVQWFNNLTKNGGSVNSNQDNMSVSYNPNKPFDNSHIQESIKYNVTAKPVFSGCIKNNGKYVAYTQQGTILNEVSSSDCQKLIEQNDRPFNYFASENQQSERSAHELQVSNPETSSL